MNRRKAKKQIKKKWRRWGLKRWPGNSSPREVDLIYSLCSRELTAAIGEILDHAILYGSGDGGLHVAPAGIFRRPD